MQDNSVRKITVILEDLDADWLEQQPGKNTSEKLRGVLRNNRKNGLPDFIAEELQPLPDFDTSSFATKDDLEVLSKFIDMLTDKYQTLERRVNAIEEK